MTVMKMVLADDSEIVISEFTFPIHIVVTRDTKDEILSIWNSLTEDNLKTVQITQDGEVMFQYQNCSVTGEQIVVNADKTYTGHYYLDGERKALDSDYADYAAAGKILLGEES